MNNNVETLKGFSNLLYLINSGSIVVLRVNSITSFSFNEYLKGQLEISYPNQIKYADINEIDIMENEYFSSSYTQFWIKALGLIEQRGLPSGYYLFLDGNVTAYHPASINFSDKSTKVAGALGVLHGIFAKDANKGFNTFSTIFEMRQASSISNFFIGALTNAINNKNNYQSRQEKYEHKVVKSELDYAYEILGVKKISSMKEIKKAKISLVKKYHPDLNPDNVEECTRYCADIISAFDLIKKSREN